MYREHLIRDNEYQWHIDPLHHMRVPTIFFANAELIQKMDEKVFEQINNVASLPGIVQAGFTMPDGHWGYGFPIGGVAAFDAEAKGVISAGGVGFDISCGVRTLLTGLTWQEIQTYQTQLADTLFMAVPSGMGGEGRIHLNEEEMHQMLVKGAKWAIQQGYGVPEDLEFTEEQGTMLGAVPEYVSEQAKKRQAKEMGTLGSGNHYLEIQVISEIYDTEVAKAYGLVQDEIVVSIHSGSRGLGHQIGTDYLKEMNSMAAEHELHFPDPELACAPIHSALGQRYLGAMRSAINCALANRQIISHWVRQVFQQFFPDSNLKLLYDVSHNTCKEEQHWVNGQNKTVYIHRKGATRAFGPNHPAIPSRYQSVGQPVLIGGSMGTCSYILAGTKAGETLSFSSSCHGAGRALSRSQAAKRWSGRQLRDTLAKQGIYIRSISERGIAEEAPEAYKDVTEVVNSAEGAGISRKIAKLLPLVCVKG